MKRPKYHFFRATQTPYGKSLLSLPGQTFGQIPVTAGILVKDARGSRAVENARRRATPGDILFTTTLKRNGLSLTASDMHLLDKEQDVFLADAREAYESLTASTGEQPVTPPSPSRE